MLPVFQTVIILKLSLQILMDTRMKTNLDSWVSGMWSWRVTNMTKELQTVVQENQDLVFSSWQNTRGKKLMFLSETQSATICFTLETSSDDFLHWHTENRQPSSRQVANWTATKTDKNRNYKHNRYEKCTFTVGNITPVLSRDDSVRCKFPSRWATSEQLRDDPQWNFSDVFGVNGVTLHSSLRNYVQAGVVGGCVEITGSVTICVLSYLAESSQWLTLPSLAATCCLHLKSACSCSRSSLLLGPSTHPYCTTSRMSIFGPQSSKYCLV